MFDGGTLMAVEVAGTVLLFLACFCACGVALLALYFAGKLLQALQRYAVRQLRAKAFAQVRLNELPAFSSECALGHVVHHQEWIDR